jgi:hypothetical protein
MGLTVGNADYAVVEDTLERMELCAGWLYVPWAT